MKGRVFRGGIGGCDQVAAGVIGIRDTASAVTDCGNTARGVGQRQGTAQAVLHLGQVIAAVGELNLHAAGMIKRSDFAGGVEVQFVLVQGLVAVGGVGVLDQSCGVTRRRIVSTVRQFDEDFAVQALLDNHGVAEQGFYAQTAENSASLLDNDFIGQNRLIFASSDMDVKS